MAELQLTAGQLKDLRHILATHLPEDAKVSVFGSRATGLGLKPHSDLDLLINSPRKLALLVIADLREALAESSLPFSVDLLLAEDAEPRFLAQIQGKGMVDLSLSTAEHT